MRVLAAVDRGCVAINRIPYNIVLEPNNCSSEQTAIRH